MSNYYVGVDENGQAYLAHFGIKGMKWGIRRYQNPDGTLTEAGAERVRKRYQKTSNKFYKAANASDYWMNESISEDQKARRLFQTADRRAHHSQASAEALRNSDWNARRAIRAMDKMNKYFGEQVTNLDPELVRRGNQMIERHNSIALTTLSYRN